MIDLESILPASSSKSDSSKISSSSSSSSRSSSGSSSSSSKSGSSGSGNSSYIYYINVDKDYRFCQDNYSRFVINGKNVGCSATALATGLSIMKGETVSPNSNSVGWSKDGCTWNPSSVKNTGDLQKRYQIAYNNLSNGKPSLMHVQSKNPNGHWVTITGVKKGANYNNLKASDFIIIDPDDGKEKGLNAYSQYSGSNVIRTFK